MLLVIVLVILHSHPLLWNKVGGRNDYYYYYYYYVFSSSSSSYYYYYYYPPNIQVMVFILMVWYRAKGIMPYVG